MKSAILSIGDELVLGQTVDSNSAYLSARLAEKGIPTLFHQTLADDQDMVVRAMRDASRRAQIVLVTGGLGPTADDLTRQALAEAMGVCLVMNEQSLREIETFFAQRQKVMPERNRCQALHPQGSEPLPNAIGTAPGIKVQFNEATFYIMPGVPREMVHMYQTHVEPDILQFAGGRQVILTAKINTFGLGESGVAEKLDELMDRDRNPKVGTTVANGIVAARIRSEFTNASVASRELNDTITQVADRLGPIVFGRDDDTLQEAVVDLLQKKGLITATAESCTGGLLSKMITDVPGSSAVFRGGWVTYSNEAKAAELDIPMDMIETHGAVSEPVVRAMAEAAAIKSGADIALSISGVAGPTGGTDEKPVGTVWIGLAHRLPIDPDETEAASPEEALDMIKLTDAEREQPEPQTPPPSVAEDDAGPEEAPDTRPLRTDARLFHFPGDRTTIRDRTAKSALQMLRLVLMQQPLDLISWTVTPSPAIPADEAAASVAPDASQEAE